MPKVSIVIPTYNHWDMSHNQLFQLYKKEKKNIDYVLLVDDCSPDEEVQNGIKWWKADWKEKPDPMPIHCLTNPQNIGFLLSSNVGLRKVSGIDDTKPDDIIILLSSDVLINGEFVPQIVEILGGNPKSLVGGILYSKDTGWNKFNEKIFPYLEGWLLATTVSGWQELGYFDERFSPNDFEDVDISTTALSLGYELIPLNNPAVHHIGAQSLGYNDKRLALTNSNKKKFEEKWIK